MYVDLGAADLSDAPLNDLQRSHLETVASTRQGKRTGVDVRQISTVGEATEFLKSVRGLPGPHEPDIPFML
jgi:hypothetical protein